MTGDITRLLERAREGDAVAADELFEIVQSELRAIAARQMRNERSDHTLQATALVNEAYMRLAGKDALQFENRAHFLRVVAQVMRRLLVDHARTKGRVKRGGDFKRDQHEPLDAMIDRSGIDLVELNDALEHLALLSPRQAQLVELRFFAGLTAQEAADVLRISKRTADGDWLMARAWLASQLRDNSDPNATL